MREQDMKRQTVQTIKFRFIKVEAKEVQSEVL